MMFFDFAVSLVPGTKSFALCANFINRMEGSFKQDVGQGIWNMVFEEFIMNKRCQAEEVNVSLLQDYAYLSGFIPLLSARKDNAEIIMKCLALNKEDRVKVFSIRQILGKYPTQKLLECLI